MFELRNEEVSTKMTSAEAASTPVDVSEKVRFEKAALRISLNDESPTYLSPEQKRTSRKLYYPKIIIVLMFRLLAMDQLDQTRAAREEALNSLEAYIYRSRDFLDDELFQKVSSEDERTSFQEKLSAASEWLFSSDSSTLEDFKSKLAELTYPPSPPRIYEIILTFRNIEGPISKRKADYLARPQQIEVLQGILNSTKEFLKTSREVLSSQSPPIDQDNLDEEPIPSTNPSTALFKLDEKAIETLDSVVEEVESWLTAKRAAQDKLQLWEEPVLLLTDLEKKNNQIQSALRKIIMDASKQKTKSTSATKKATTSTSTQSVVPTEETYTEVNDDESTFTTTATVTSTIVVDDTSSSSTTPTSKSEMKHEEL